MPLGCIGRKSIEEAKYVRGSGSGAESRIARELTKPVRALGVALLVLWTLHTVVVTGPLLLSAHYVDLLRGTPQGALRAPLGNPIQDATPAVVASLPPQGDVLALVPASEVDGFAYFWLTYWLYPRHVEISADLARASTTSATGIVYFQRPGAPALNPPADYVPRADIATPGGDRTLVFVKAGA
jgi:hypothetical protein